MESGKPKGDLMREETKGKAKGGNFFIFFFTGIGVGESGVAWNPLQQLDLDAGVEWT